MQDDDLTEKRQDPLADASLKAGDDGKAAGDIGDDTKNEDGAGAEPSPASLTDDVSALLEDGKTYAEAELAFQKSRLAYASKLGRSAALLGLFALGFVHLALIALVVGMVIALSPILTPLGATLAVTAVLVLAALTFVLIAKQRIAELTKAFSEDET